MNGNPAVQLSEGACELMEDGDRKGEQAAI